MRRVSPMRIGANNPPVSRTKLAPSLFAVRSAWPTALWVLWISPDGLRLDRRISNLLQRFGGVWRESLSQFATAISFKRGFVEFVTMKAAGLLQHGEELFASAPVRHIDLTDVRDVDERLFASPFLAGLRSLGMDGCGLYSFHIRLLAHSGVTAGLRWLSLEHNHLDIGAAEALAASAHCKNLRYAEFNGNPFDPMERMGWDSGALISVDLPPEGEELERRFGILPWLHRSNGKLSRFDA